MDMAPGVEGNTAERPYTELDLFNKTRPQLVAMVQRQRDKWPWKEPKWRFNPSKTKLGVLTDALLNASFGFTTPNVAASGASQIEGGGLGGPIGLGNDAQADGGSGLSNLNVPGPMQVENQGAQREGEGGAPGLDIALEHKMVRVLIEDQCHTPSKKSLAIIKLSITKGDHANKWGVQAGELWRELQNSLACISGPAKISYPDPITPEYSQCIVNKATNQDAATLEGPSNGAQRHRRPAHEVHSAEDLKSKKNAACTLNNQVIAWLRDQASNQPGHDTFMESRVCLEII
ncbi:hypothetical protein DFH94DRAFT_844082, partial [Russula ochroleuca]